MSVCVCVLVCVHIALCALIPYNVSFIEGITWLQSHTKRTLNESISSGWLCRGRWTPVCSGCSLRYNDSPLYKEPALRLSGTGWWGVGGREGPKGRQPRWPLGHRTCWFTAGSPLTADSVMKRCTLLVLTVSDKETTSQRGVTSQRLPASRAREAEWFLRVHHKVCVLSGTISNMPRWWVFRIDVVIATSGERSGCIRFEKRQKSFFFFSSQLWWPGTHSGNFCEIFAFCSRIHLVKSS